jgi:hypothetical protein
LCSGLFTALYPHFLVFSKISTFDGEIFFGMFTMYLSIGFSTFVLLDMRWVFDTWHRRGRILRVRSFFAMLK